MKKEIEFYRCKHCGNVITFLKNSDVPVYCCGEEMEKLTANTTDAVVEKHIPSITVNDDITKAVVGSITHPMLPEHYIEWIACESDGRVEIKFLEPGVEPAAEFFHVSTGTIYEYCNLHGLWKADF